MRNSIFVRIVVSLGLTFLIASSVGAQTLRYFSWETNIAEETAALIAEFEALYPGVTVEFEALPPNQYWPRMSALAAANDLPDVFYMSSGFISEWQANGLVANLEPYLSGINLEDYYSGVLSVARFPSPETGDLHAVPINWVGPVLYYNASAFDEAGLGYPNDNWTWDDFLAAAKALTIDKTGDGRIDQYGFWLYGRYAQIEPWIYMNDGRLLNEARTRLEPNAQAIEALTFLADLTNVHEVAPKPLDMEGIRQQDVFPLGIAAMWVDGSWNISNNRSITGDDFVWDIAMIPAGPSSSGRIGYTWPDMLAMSPNSASPDLAWAFVEFMTGPSRDASSFLGGTVPFYRATAESEAWLERDQQPASKDLLLELGRLPSRTSFTPNWSDWRGYGAAEGGGMNGELDMVFNGRKGIDAAIAAFLEYGNQVLTRSFPQP
jgi:multiple sugar transport system substrate-binding protein